MKNSPYETVRMDQLATEIPRNEPDWLWSGYLARGEITLFTSEWKLGKTTLLAGLLRAFDRGEAFLGRACSLTRVLVVSEESRLQWAERGRAIELGENVRLMSRPFPRRPTADQWDELIHYVDELRADCKLGVLVIDTLAAFLPGYSEAIPSTLLAMLHPLRRLATSGVAILILHHPSKKMAGDGYHARGNGVLLGFMDIALEMHRLSSASTDTRRRRLLAFSRHPETPSSLVFEWTPGSPDFHVLDDLVAVRFRENWQIVAQILSRRAEAMTHRQLLDEWPPENPPPSASQLYHWLSRAVDEQLATRSGRGTRSDPYRFLLGAAQPPEHAEQPLPALDG